MTYDNEEGRDGEVMDQRVHGGVGYCRNCYNQTVRTQSSQLRHIVQLSQYQRVGLYVDA